LLDLSKSEDDLLKAMHEKTRYNIRLAGRKALRLAISNQQPAISHDNFENFWRLMRETAKRDGIRLHPKTYYQKMGEVLSGANSNVKYLISNIQYQKEWLAAGVFIGFGDTFTYVHGGSSSEHRELMAPYLMHWEAIKFAKNAGYRYYDFGGVNPEDATNQDFRPKWAGITRFKRGFGGFIQSYAGAYDLPFNKTGYKLYRLIKKIV
jgi:lipid II:glycine glycyltransferase (peptidoglycan interpeptide bridge formation enzyme)